MTFSSGKSWRELALVVLGFGLLTIVLTAPLSFHLGSMARLDNADTRYIIWNVAWVARTLVVDPLHVFDANIFYPHRWTLVYSESNLGAGVLAIPAYWATRNPYFAHNFVVLLSFVLSGVATYYLVKHLARDRRAAAIAGICYAFCPYVYSHLPHLHLLMTFGLPLCMLAFHRLADRPSWGRGAALGAVVGVQAFFSGYYAIFVGLMVGFAAIVIAALQRRWMDTRYWTALALAGVVTAAVALPLFVPYWQLKRETGFSRPLHESRAYSATVLTYFSSPAYAHRWMLPLIKRWNEVLFPGFVAAVAGAAGLVAGWRSGGRLREATVLYGGLGIMAFWASMGPDAGLYLAMGAVVPGFSFMHAPSRFGLVVTFTLCVLAGIALALLFAKLERTPVATRRAAAVATFLLAVTVLEHKVPLGFWPVPPLEPAYRMLAALPKAPVIELPFYSWRSAAARTEYVLNSTAHWMPLVNGYSSFTPPDFQEKTPALGEFPSLESFAILERDRVRYAMFHLDRFEPDARDAVIARIRAFNRYLAPLYTEGAVWLYEIVEYPHRP